VSVNARNLIGVALATAVLVLPIGIALGQGDSGSPEAPTPQELMSDEGRQDVIDGYEAARAACEDVPEDELEQSPCERVLNGDMLGAPGNMPEEGAQP
jgi:hypothetical protein